MGIETTIKKIERNIKFILGLEDVEIHVQDFENQDSEPTYIKYKLPEGISEKRSFKIYKKLSGILRLNCPEVSISYNTPYTNNKESRIRKIIAEVNSNKNPDEKLKILGKASEDLNYVLKRLAKYGIKK